MNKKEIAEIKKQFTQERCAITRICGCYVDGEKNKKTELKEAFLSLPEEEMFKYFAISAKLFPARWVKISSLWNFPWHRRKPGVPRTF